VNKGRHVKKGTGDWELPISEAELGRLTRELDEAHQEAVPKMRASAGDLLDDVRAADSALNRSSASRRGLLLGAGGLATAVTLAACTSGSGTATVNATGSGPASGPASPSTYTGDLKVVALAVALENQAVGAYTAALAAAKAKKLGNVPPAVATFATTAMSQHAEHAAVWNSVLTGAGKPAIHNVPLSNQPATLKALASATNASEVAKLALSLENQAAQTYLFATYNVKSAAGIMTAATISPVEAMHAAILNYVLGQYPIPDAFLPVDKAASPSLLTV
jgi:hypothetical protein